LVLVLLKFFIWMLSTQVNNWKFMLYSYDLCAFMYASYMKIKYWHKLKPRSEYHKTIPKRNYKPDSSGSYL
jgi:hypothetical protein